MVHWKAQAMLIYYLCLLLTSSLSNCVGSDFVVLKETNFIWRLKFMLGLIDKVYIFTQNNFSSALYLLLCRFRDRQPHYIYFPAGLEIGNRIISTSLQVQRQASALYLLLCGFRDMHPHYIYFPAGLEIGIRIISTSLQGQRQASALYLLP